MSKFGNLYASGIHMSSCPC